MNDFVFDFETLGTEPDSVVLSMAMTVFGRHDPLLSFEQYIKNTYYWKFDVQSQIEAGRKIEKDTLDWWERQDKEVADSQLRPSPEDITLVNFLTEFFEVWHKENLSNKSLGWCRGQSFDFPIFANIIKTTPHHLTLNPAMFPCPFYNQRDIRSYIAGAVGDPTVSNLNFLEFPDFKKHNPIHDCAKATYEIKYAQNIDEELDNE